MQEYNVFMYVCKSMNSDILIPIGKLALPTLASTPGSRLIAVSSGGMYNSNFPPWDIASHSSSSGSAYDGQMAYCYAKRGQVLLCERWAKKFAGQVTIVSCHPGQVHLYLQTLFIFINSATNSYRVYKIYRVKRLYIAEMTILVLE